MLGLRLGTAFVPLAGSAAAITGTAASLTSIAANGWTATWNGTPPTFTPDAGASSQHYASVFRQGFDASGNTTNYLDRHVVTSRVRQAFPNQASLTTADCSLSEYVYSTDTISGVTNNSTQISPTPVANWVMPHRQVVGNSLTLEIVAFHRDNVACVQFSATDGTHTVTQNVSATVVSGRTGDQNAVLVYQATLDISTLTDNALVTCNAKVFPRIGATASVADSSTSSVLRGFSPRYFLKNTTLAASPPFAYVSTTGNDTTGVVSTNATTAAASPFLTVLGAINAIHTALSGTTGVDGAIIRIGNDGGTPFVLGSTAVTRTQKCGVLTIARDPNVAKANARVSFGLAGFRPRLGGSLLTGLTEGALQFKDVQIVRTGTSTIQGETATALGIIYDQVTFDNGSNNATWLSTSHDYHYGTSFLNLTGNSALGAGTNEHRILRGISVDINFGGIEGWLTLGSAITRSGAFGRGTRSFSGAINAFNKFPNPTTAGGFLAPGADADVVGFAVVQNLLEYISATASNDIAISADSATGNNTHVILWNNTCTGAFQAGRWNAFYDEGTTRRTSALMSVKGNIAVAIYTKSDVFLGTDNNGSPDTVNAPNATGNWAFEYGVGCAYNFTQFEGNNLVGQASSQAQNYAGLAANYGTSQTTRHDPLFTSYQGTTVAAGPVFTAGAGGGDYHLQSGSPCRGMMALYRLLTHDLDGNARPTTADTVGAYV